MTLRVFIDGAVGTTGLEIAERLAGRPDIRLIALEEDRRKDDAARAEALNSADIAILCLPDEAARAAVALVSGSKTRVIDASSAHRTAAGWTYGFPELVGPEAVANARLVANPGCYPTGFLALVAPLVRAGILRSDWPYACHAVSGYSGGGKALIARYAADAPPAFRAYGLHGGHKHLTEMQALAGLAHPPQFAPAVVPAYRGMIVEVPIPRAALTRPADAAALRGALATFFADSATVRVAAEERDRSEIVLEPGFAPTDAVALHIFGAADGTMRLIAVLDNLGKGAAGAAVQNLNLMAGLPETAGLRL